MISQEIAPTEQISLAETASHRRIYQRIRSACETACEQVINKAKAGGTDACKKIQNQIIQILV